MYRVEYSKTSRDGVPDLVEHQSCHMLWGSGITNACMQVCARSGLAAILAAERSAGVIPELNLRNLLHTGNEKYKQGCVYPGFETQGKCHQKCKTVYQWPHKKDLCPPKYFLKNFTNDKNCTGLMRLKRGTLLTRMIIRNVSTSQTYFIWVVPDSSTTTSHIEHTQEKISS